MSELKNIDGARSAALDRIDRRERNFRLILIGGAVWECIFLVTLLMVADFSNPTHLLLVVASIGIYTTLALGLIALGAHLSRTMLRVIKAVEVLKG